MLLLGHTAGSSDLSLSCVLAATGGECDSLNQVDVSRCVKCIRENRDMIVGVKVRLSSSVTNAGLFEEEVYRYGVDRQRHMHVSLVIELVSV